MVWMTACESRSGYKPFSGKPSESPVLPQITPSVTTRLPDPTSTPQASQPPVSFGPDLENFPPYINPLTGLPVADPALLDLPAMLVSITHFPPNARPQAGLSFAPWVFDYLISSGSTRFLAVFYGEYPTREIAITGSCEMRNEPFIQSGFILGNRVWLDKNKDGLQEVGEPGVPGVCINLLDASSGKIIDTSTTDSNGFYAFNVETGNSYVLEFESGGLLFTIPNIGLEDQDSDIFPLSGRTEIISVKENNLLIDAGMILVNDTQPTQTPASPSGVVGPVRSARLVNIHIQNFFQDSCLIYAGSTREIRDQIPGCAEVFKKGDGGAGSMLEIARMVSISEDNARKRRSNFNYAHNLYQTKTPADGQAINQLDVYVAELNQSAWVYDPAMQAWWRYVDDADKEHPGILHPDTDRLNDRQIFFENVIVLFAEHEVLAPAIIEMHLEQGESGNALLLRDGQMFEITWSTRAAEYEQRTGYRRPLAFLDKQGNPFPLHPGRLWIIIATPFSQIDPKESGHYKLHIIAPAGAGNY